MYYVLIMIRTCWQHWVHANSSLLWKIIDSLPLPTCQSCIHWEEVPEREFANWIRRLSSWWQLLPTPPRQENFSKGQSSWIWPSSEGDIQRKKRSLRTTLIPLIHYYYDDIKVEIFFFWCSPLGRIVLIFNSFSR